jgi:hypothetical protein
MHTKRLDLLDEDIAKDVSEKLNNLRLRENEEETLKIALLNSYERLN